MPAFSVINLASNFNSPCILLRIGVGDLILRAFTNMASELYIELT